MYGYATTDVPAATSAAGPALLVLWRRRRGWFLAVLAIVFSGAAAGIAALPDVYRGSVSILVEPRNIAQSVEEKPQIDDSEARLQAIREQIVARAPLQALIEQFDLYPRLRVGSYTPEEAIEAMRRNVRFDLKSSDPMSARGGTISFSLNYLSEDPRLAAQVANALATGFIKANVQGHARQEGQAADFLTTQLAEAKTKLEEQEKRLSAYKEKSNGELPEQMEGNLSTLTRLSSQIASAEERENRLNDRRDQLSRQVASIDPGVANADVGVAEMERLRAQLAELKTKYKDKHPAVVQVREQMEALARRLNSGDGGAGKLDARAAGADANPGGGRTPSTTPHPPDGPSSPAGGSVAGRLKRALSQTDADLRAVRAEQDTLHQQIAVYQQRVERAPAREAEVAALQREYETAKETYNSLLKRSSEAHLREDLAQAQDQFRILDPAVVARHPVAPNRMQLLVGALLLAAALAAGVVLVVERRDTTFHSPEDLRAFTRLPILADIPRLETRAAAWRLRRRALTLACTLGAGWLCVVAVGAELGRRVGPAIVAALGDHP
ncbi:MAG TPA: GNVR domain-containing protein [Candidatus Polarisedimenticolia bacterium]|nr:GNVR domain-containing protein [Candidatus Polarisedimenticolia bacterium]